jgi:hypothetical protein
MHQWGHAFRRGNPNASCENVGQGGASMGATPYSDVETQMIQGQYTRLHLLQWAHGLSDVETRILLNEACPQ